MTARAQSETVGVILLTAVVVLTVGTVGAVVFTEVNTAETTRADLAVSVADDGVAVTHNGGEPIAFADLEVVVRSGDETWRPPMNESGVVRGDGDDRFQPSERWVWRQSLDTGEVTTVRVFDQRTGELLAEARRYPTAEVGLTPTATSTAATPSTETSTPVETATPTATATATPTGTATATATATSTSTSTPTPTPGPDTTPPSVTVDAPNGGESFRGGSTTTIQWSATDAESGVDSVDIAYSSDGGANWSTVVTSTANDGRYDWTVPTDNTTDAVIRVSATDSAGNTANDTSNATFTVDSAPPTVESVTTTTTSGSKGKTKNLTVDWSVSDEIRLSNVTVELRQNGLSQRTVNQTLSGTAASGETTFSDVPKNEEYTVVVIVNDSVGLSDRSQKEVSLQEGKGNGNN
ncbi:type IV pilin N-terminal domain-containing protein [Halolamina rubra]|uniref:type IV pilin N-terminal domain-containing protein n=1 Tax=Halolamina rubra TaxID=1380430 RepID=UPI00067919FB|nr:type IV pilin N-terminal domain-containing protein [Halolamina rubra]